MEREKERVNNYLNSETEEKLLKVVIEELLEKQETILLERFVSSFLAYLLHRPVYIRAIACLPACLSAVDDPQRDPLSPSLDTDTNDQPYVRSFNLHTYIHTYICTHTERARAAPCS